MVSDKEAVRFVYQTKEVCPPEIHFQIREERLEDIRFVGGGCPGNAQLASRLLKGKLLNEAIEVLQNIPCRNNTSCPDQLAQALLAAGKGELGPAQSFRVHTDGTPMNRIALIGDMDGQVDHLKNLVREIHEKGADAICCVGNLTGNSAGNKELIRLVQKEKMLAVQGELDWRYAEGKEHEDFPALGQKERDALIRLPQILSFRLGMKRGMAFFGQYLQEFPGISDFDPFVLEMNMVCRLSDFLQNEAVFPALKAMTPQFDARIVIFGEMRKWGHWRIGDADFISLGPAHTDKEGIAWGLLEDSAKGIHFEVLKTEE